MKARRFVAISVILCIIFSGFSFGEQTNKENKNIKLFTSLKINHFFVLYTKPNLRYDLTNTRLMVPVKLFCSKFMDAKVDFIPQSKAINIVFDNKRVQLTMGSKRIITSNGDFDLDIEPMIVEGTTYVPLRAIIDAFHIKSTWNAQYRYIHIEDERLMKSNRILGTLDVYGGGTDDNNAFIPLSSVLNIKESEGAYHYTLTAKMKNVTGKKIEEGKEFISPINYYKGVDGIRDPYGKRGPAIDVDEVFNYTNQSISDKASSGELEVLLLWGRTLK